jgi:SAM-dependent methyltransferase
MLKLADVKTTDIVYGLGCGVGRIVIAAKEFGAHGVGIDINPQRVQKAKENAMKAGVERLIGRVTLAAGNSAAAPSAVAPGNMLHHDAVLGTLHPSWRVAKKRWGFPTEARIASVVQASSHSLARGAGNANSAAGFHRAPLPGSRSTVVCLPGNAGALRGKQIRQKCCTRFNSVLTWS